MNVIEPQSYQLFDSLPGRLKGVIRSPYKLFRFLVAHPRWSDALTTALLIMAISSAAVLATEVGRQALVDQWERTATAFGQTVDDARYAQFEEMSAYGVGYAILTAILSGPVLAIALAGAIVVIFTKVIGGQGTFTQALAITAHASVILAIRQLVAAPLSYARETLASATTFGAFFPMLDEASPAARFFGAIDLFVIWWVIVLAIGVSLLYRRSARSTVAAFIGAYVGVAAVLAIAMAATGGIA